MIESLESRQLLSAAHVAAAVHSTPAPAVHASVSHRHRAASTLSLLGDYDTTFKVRGHTVHLTLNIDHQHLGHVSGSAEVSNVPIVGTASVDFTGVVNADDTFSLTFTGDADGTASGSFTPDYKSASVTYDFTALGISFSGTRTFTR